jgi:hypothetical protein
VVRRGENIQPAPRGSAIHAVEHPLNQERARPAGESNCTAKKRQKTPTRNLLNLSHWAFLAREFSPWAQFASRMREHAYEKNRRALQLSAALVESTARLAAGILAASAWHAPRPSSRERTCRLTKALPSWGRLVLGCCRHKKA